MSDDFSYDFQLLLALVQSAATEDRTLAIICTSYAEKYLGDLIQVRMPGLNRDLREKMFKPEGVLGTFSARIDMGKALETFDADTHHDLKLMGSLRNRFAHSLEVNSFDHPNVASYMDRIRAKPILTDPMPEVDERAALEHAALTRRDKFILFGTTVCMKFHNALSRVQTAHE